MPCLKNKIIISTAVVIFGLLAVVVGSQIKPAKAQDTSMCPRLRTCEEACSPSAGFYEDYEIADCMNKCQNQWHPNWVAQHEACLNKYYPAPAPAAPTITLPTSGTYAELYAAWEKYCRWGTAGITDAQCQQLESAYGRAYEAEHPSAPEPSITPAIMPEPESAPEPAPPQKEVEQNTPTPKPAALPKSAQQIDSEPSDSNISETDYSAILMESVSKKHTDELSSIKIYYSQKSLFIPATDKEYAQHQLDQTRSLGMEVVNAKNDYRDALNKGASNSEAANLKDSYGAKLQDLKSQLQEVLSVDGENSDALWQLGTLSKWEGDNKSSYENYRDALVSEKSRNPFKYQKLLDSIKDPAIRTEILRNMEPNENIIEIPTVETSPFLAGLKNNLDALLQPISSAKKTAIGNIEKIARAFSLSDKLDKIRKELGITE